MGRVKKVRLITVGDSGVGKTSVIKYFVDGEKVKADAASVATVGVDHWQKNIPYGDGAVIIQFWDTAGQERFRNITSAYYRSGDGIALFFDVTSRASFDSVSTWLTQIRSKVAPTVPILLVGNKIDLEERRSIDFGEATAFADDNDLQYMETSAVTGEGIDDMVNALTRLTYDNLPFEDEQPTKEVSLKSGHKHKNGCC